MDKDQVDSCEILCIHEEKVREMQKKLAGLPPMAFLFKAMSDESRVRILYALGQDELCVCDVAQLLGTTVANASHHLRVLRSVGLARCRKEGKMVYYSIDDEHVRILLETAIDHVREER